MRTIPRVGSQWVLHYSISVPEMRLGTQSCTLEKLGLVRSPMLDLSVHSAGNEAQPFGHPLHLAHTFSALFVTQIICTPCMYIINLSSIKKKVGFFSRYSYAVTKKGSPALPPSSSFSSDASVLTSA